MLRPGIQRILENDCKLMQFFGRFVARIPAFESIPVREAIDDTCHILLNQTNFAQEASNLHRLSDIFGDHPDIIVPQVYENLCTRNILVMEYLPGLRKLSDLSLPEDVAKTALTIGVRALYTMIFKEGFIHCDLHPGNILVAPDHRVVILDAGFMTQLHSSTRRSFAQFFLAIAFRNGKSAAQIVRATAQQLPPHLDIQTFDQDIDHLIQQVGGLQAHEFQVADFVAKLFAIQRKHRIYGTNQFTLVILSLLVFEGVAKQRFPDLNFQRESVPFVMAALAS